MSKEENVVKAHNKPVKLVFQDVQMDILMWEGEFRYKFSDRTSSEDDKDEILIGKRFNSLKTVSAVKVSSV